MGKVSLMHPSREASLLLFVGLDGCLQTSWAF